MRVCVLSMFRLFWLSLFCFEVKSVFNCSVLLNLFSLYIMLILLGINVVGIFVYLLLSSVCDVVKWCLVLISLLLIVLILVLMIVLNIFMLKFLFIFWRCLLNFFCCRVSNVFCWYLLCWCLLFVNFVIFKRFWIILY